jgi:hypothetical protein
MNQGDVPGARALAESPYLGKLTHLSLFHNFFGEDEEEDEVIAALEARFGEGLEL